MSSSILGDGYKPSVLKDPFKKEKIESVHMHIYPKNRFGKKCRGSVEFTNGSTEGTQNFEGDDFESLYTQIRTFIEQL